MDPPFELPPFEPVPVPLTVEVDDGAVDGAEVNDTREFCRCGMTNFGGACGVYCGGMLFDEGCRTSCGGGGAVAWLAAIGGGGTALLRGGIAGGGPRAVDPNELCD